MSNPFVAEIRMFAGNFAPKGWALCNGQLLPISQNTALFSLLGTTYGGDGRTNFALPNLQGTTPLGQGQGNGLSLRVLGESGGEPTVGLNMAEMPSHSHGVSASDAAGGRLIIVENISAATCLDHIRDCSSIISPENSGAASIIAGVGSTIPGPA